MSLGTGLAALALCGCSSEKAPAPGQVMVIVTTDMRVSDDIDALVYSVTRDGETTPIYRSPSVPISSLPATLAVVSGPETTGPVVIAFDAMHGGVSRVHREARLVLPTRGAKALPMPLNWLCSTDANPALTCGAGQTCQAGSCVDVNVEADTLADYVASEAGACFDVAGCLGGASFTTASRDSSLRCTIMKAIVPAGQSAVNVGLVIDTAAHGNTGVCIAGQGCVIPLVHDSPEGWHTLAGDAGGPGILLPSAVCDDQDHGAVRTIAITQSCPVQQTLAPPCDGPEECVAAGVCPPGWGRWSGYTCSGKTVQPTGLFCANTWSDADAGAGVSTRSFCCTQGETPSTDPLLIDDMSGGSQIKITAPRPLAAGYWWTAADQAAPALLPPPNSLFTYTPISPAAMPDGGPVIGSAACMSSPGFSGQTALFGFNWVFQPTDYISAPPFDLTPYTGIRFWARATKARFFAVTFADPNTTTEVGTAPCRAADAGGCGNTWGVRQIPVSDAWTPYCVAWSDLRQNNAQKAVFPAFDAQHALTAQFEIAGAPPRTTPPFDLCVAQIRFVPGDAGCGP